MRVAGTHICGFNAGIRTAMRTGWVRVEIAAGQGRSGLYLLRGRLGHSLCR